MSDTGWLINKSAVKKAALEIAGKRYHKFTRVSAGFLAQANGALKDYLDKKIAGYPSVGKTL